MENFSFENLNKSRKENILKSFDSNIYDAPLSDIDQEISKAIELDVIEKGGKRAVAGEIREWSGKKYQKTTQGWIPVKGENGEKKEESKKDEKEQKLDLSKHTDEELDNAIKVRHRAGTSEKDPEMKQLIEEREKRNDSKPKEDKKSQKSYDEIRKMVGQKYNDDMINSIKESLLDSDFNSSDLKIKHNGTQEGEINAIGQKVDNLYKELRPGMEHKDLTEEGVKDILEGMIVSYNNYDGDSKFTLD